MPLISEELIFNRRVKDVFFLIDTSESMNGEKIDSLNTRLEKFILEMKECMNADFQIKINLLAISSGKDLQNSEPINIEDFKWKNLQTSGVNELGKACIKLNEKLSQNSYLEINPRIFPPAVVLITGSNPTDDFYKNYKVLRNNIWFLRALKIAITVGDKVDENLLADFTGNSEAILPICNITKSLRLIMRYTAVGHYDISEVANYAPYSKKNYFEESDKTDLEENNDWEEVEWL